MKPGAIIEYIDDQKVICAVVLEVQQNRLRILSENNRESSFSTKRPAHFNHMGLDLSMHRDQLVNRLQALARERQALAPKVDIKGLWEVLQIENNWIDLPTITELCFPNHTDADHQSAVMRALFYNRSFFKFNHDRFFPYTPQQVRQNLNKIIQREQRRYLIRIGHRWLRAVSQDEAIPRECLPHQERLIEVIKSYVLFEKESPHQALVKAIMDKADVQSSEALFNALIRAGEFERHENLDLIRLGTPLKFPAPIIAAEGQLAPFTNSPSDNGKRRDLTFLTTYTIDGQSTLDFDDALSLQSEPGGFRLGVHIADVGYYVTRGSLFDREAIKRASSIYTPDLKIPMLPNRLADDLCSLKANNLRPTITLMIHLDQQGTLQHYEIFPSYIKVGRQLTYFEVNQRIQHSRTLQHFAFLADCFRRQRLDAGAVHINLPEIGVRLNDDQSVCVQRHDRESPSRKLVSEIMIKSNQIMAKALSSNGLPGIFRSQTEPKERLFKGQQNDLLTNILQRRLLGRFALSSMPGPHAGLGVEAYVTATSPIRRYTDLVTQRQIKALCGFGKPYNASQIEGLIETLEPLIANVGRIQTLRQRYWVLVYLTSLIGQRLEALVIMKRRHDYQLLLPEYMLECKLPIRQYRLQPGEIIRVTLQHVNARNDTLVVFLS